MTPSSPPHQADITSPSPSTGTNSPAPSTGTNSPAPSIDTTSPTPSIDIAGLLVLALMIVLLGGALLTRLVGPGDPAGSSDPAGSPDSGAIEAVEESEAGAGPIQEGSRAPDFTLLDPEGRSASLSDWRDRPVLINFWATWCGPCEIEMPTLQAAAEAYRDEGLVVLAVAVEDSVENVTRFYDEYGLTFQALMDDGSAARAYQVFGLPTSFFVGRDGTVAAKHTGLLTERAIEGYLAALLEE